MIRSLFNFKSPLGILTEEYGISFSRVRVTESPPFSQLVPTLFAHLKVEKVNDFLGWNAYEAIETRCMSTHSFVCLVP